MRNFDNILKQIDLRTRLKVANEMSFISLLTELGYREEKYWTPDEDELLGKLMKSASEHTDWLLEEINKWEEDGRP